MGVSLPSQMGNNQLRIENSNNSANTQHNRTQWGNDRAAEHASTNHDQPCCEVVSEHAENFFEIECRSNPFLNRKVCIYLLYTSDAADE